MKTSTVIIKVQLNENNIPKEIRWHAEDSDMEGDRPVKCMFVSMYDEEKEETLKMDLWTEEFMVEEMDMFIFQTLRSMADSYHKATNNSDLANRMVEFAHYFGQQTEILKPENPEDVIK